MRTLVLLWVALAGAGAQLPCPEGGPCPVTPALPARSAVGCQDGSSCPASTSCSLPESVPCAGGQRCCPRGSHCGADGESCIPDPAPRAVPCPDGTSECPDDATCCVTASGAWGCCPMPQASCCADKVHCCPHATTCDLARGRCLSPGGDRDVPLSTAFPAWKRQPPAPVELRQVLCPGGRSACPDGATCCQLSPSEYGCCPLQNAVCCSDRQHCCPQGTTCDLTRSTCTSLGGSTSLAALPSAGEVKCDEETSCPDGNTCCRLSSGAWGCCPLEQAVCCPDHVHCCPQGYTCDPEGGSCLQGGGTRLPWVRKTPALPRGAQVTSGNVKCDEETSCPDGSTCCQLSLGTWGCCPLEKAVCCPDHVHCCPQGYTCDPEGGSCLQGGGTRLPWVRKTPALPRGAQVTSGNVKCDEETSCPDGSTCCQLSLGTWGCCPLEQAVCCGDHKHCCPRGYTCNVATESCEKLLAPTPLLPAPADPRGAPSPLRWAPPVPPAPLRATSTHPGAPVPCGATSSCCGGQRCCRAQGGSWGCCPFAQGSCCSDGRHCCPAGSRCTGGGWGCSPQRSDLPSPPARELL
ncbi:progranulin isoform X1 [Pipra filicauda]|uniref:Progranulin isoform X1 n=1 Tax=Pipra filicauda TaxID=649802 RepID=A0A6J2HQZ0_9PASS|nr:progranulin isoform X1 [Pipra filicauda]XP_027589865.1 progranulin isoform X1 [Pipra filicauda]XP_027589866.1 progranulin isoform X1 [Pipra filicauda]XP_027589868.1 progranulin isoform X1 [Pipra filicauda]